MPVFGGVLQDWSFTNDFGRGPRLVNSWQQQCLAPDFDAPQGTTEVRHHVTAATSCMSVLLTLSSLTLLAPMSTTVMHAVLVDLAKTHRTSSHPHAPLDCPADEPLLLLLDNRCGRAR